MHFQVNHKPPPPRRAPDTERPLMWEMQLWHSARRQAFFERVAALQGAGLGCREARERAFAELRIFERWAP